MFYDNYHKTLEALLMGFAIRYSYVYRYLMLRGCIHTIFVCLYKLNLSVTRSPNPQSIAVYRL